MSSSNVSFRNKYYLLLPVILAAILYSSSIKEGWWTIDDTVILRFTIENSWYKFFYNKDLWRQFAPTNLTPWINLSYAIDWHLFGLNAKGFYWHHYFSFLLSIFLCGVLIYEIFGIAVALVTLLLFIIMLPVSIMASFLWLRHYVEGLSFAALAFIFFIKGRKTGRLSHAILGAFFYLLSCTAKELYVPLIALIFFYPNTFSKSEFASKIPFLIVGLLYILWRFYMLGNNMTIGYSPILSSFIGSHFFYLLFYDLYLNKFLTYIIIFLFLTLLLFYFLKSSNSLRFYFFLILLCTLFPIAMVSFFLPEIKNNLGLSRIFICFSLILSLFFASTLKNLPKTFSPILIAFVFFVNLYTFCSKYPLSYAKEMYTKSRRLGEFLLSASPNDVLIYPYEDVYFLNELLTLYKKDPKNSPIICTDACLCKKILRNNKLNFCLFDGKEIIKKKVDCNIRNDIKPYLHVECKNGMIFWEMGPFKEGDYCILGLKNGIPKSRFCLPRRGSAGFFLYEDFDLVAVYTSPDGWIAYSDIYHLSKDKCQ